MTSSTKPVALLYLGGTFGCIGQPLSPLPAQQLLPKLTKILAPHVSPNTSLFAGREIKDSSHLQPQDWQSLAAQIQDLHQAGFDHILIIHGTDTLAYTAAFLHEFYAGSRTNIVITGSQYPLLSTDGSQLNTDSDALSNLLYALDILQTQPGIWVSLQQQYWPANQVQKIHTHALPVFTGDPAGSKAITTAPFNTAISLEQLSQLNIGVYYCLPQAAEQQLAQLKQLLDTPKLDALILLAFGSGNMLQNEQITQLLQHASQRSLIILSSQVLFGGVSDHYAAGSWLADAGVLSAQALTIAAIYARLMRICCQTDDINTRKQLWLQANDIDRGA